MISKTRMLELVRGWQWKDVAAALRESPALLAVRNERGRNWLHICCSVNPNGGKRKVADSVKTADVLLDAGLDINTEAFREGSWKATPLWHAISRGENLVLAKHLLQRGSDPNHCLWAAGFRDDLDAIALLLRAGADVDALAEDETPFLSAVKVSHFKSAQALLDAGANVDFQDSKGMTALHYMLKKGSDLRDLRMIAAHGARGDIPNRVGVTAAEILQRKRDPAYAQLAAKLTQSGTPLRSKRGS